ncbi:unnamed protein product [Ambrosiozyma monospora]|uniref:Unnamed protein product n=2 Tax=Ambrosiozyma monospora TaxID=43982 RepID=A0ACB5T0I5_AMBMO|nr:unnamed protein product [Ambrosiozyma monospora]
MLTTTATGLFASFPITVLLRRLYHEYLSAKKQYNSLIYLNTELRPTLKHFQNQPFQTKCNLSIVGSVFTVVLYVLPFNIFIKFLLFSALALLVTVPLVSQFFFFGLPILAWVFLFFSASKIPISWKPPISVKVLPALETILYGDNLSDILAASTNWPLDFLGWFPYGIVHFAAPFVVAALIWLFGPPTTLRSYGWAVGYTNLVGVLIQQVFPASPPWYQNAYGLQPANYGMDGSPGGLGRMDEHFGFDMYTTTFQNAPLIFGAFPSLHSAMATSNALWISYIFPKSTPYMLAYVCWLWWSTMYLAHHYFFDLTAGSALAVSFFYVAKLNWTPRVKPDCFCRFNYTSIDLESLSLNDPLNPDKMSIDIENDAAGVAGSGLHLNNLANPLIKDVELNDVLDTSSSTGQSTPIIEDDPYSSTSATSIIASV